MCQHEQLVSKLLGEHQNNFFAWSIRNIKHNTQMTQHYMNDFFVRDREMLESLYFILTILVQFGVFAKINFPI